jgi:hypothetical protein
MGLLKEEQEYSLQVKGNKTKVLLSSISNVNKNPVVK